MVFAFAAGCILMMFSQALAACLSISSFSRPSSCKIVGGDHLIQINE